jgi:hypothetical protein
LSSFLLRASSSSCVPIFVVMALGFSSLPLHFCIFFIFYLFSILFALSLARFPMFVSFDVMPHDTTCPCARIQTALPLHLLPACSSLTLLRAVFWILCSAPSLARRVRAYFRIYGGVHDSEYSRAGRIESGFGFDFGVATRREPFDSIRGASSCYS